MCPVGSKKHVTLFPNNAACCGERYIFYNFEYLISKKNCKILRTLFLIPPKPPPIRPQKSTPPNSGWGGGLADRPSLGRKETPP